MTLPSNESIGEEFDDTDHEEEETTDEEKKVPFDGRIRRKKIDVPPEIMNMVKQYTTWQTMEDLDNAETECSEASSDSDPTDFKIQLGKMQELSSKLNAYNFRHVYYRNSLDQEVVKSLQQVLQLFPGIENMEAYKQLSEADKYRIEVTLYYKKLDGDVDSVPEDTTDAAETNLERMLGPLVSGMEKVRAATKLCVASSEVGWRVRSYIGTLEATIYRCSKFMSHKRVKLAEPVMEIPVSAEEKFQSLCKVMKEGLGCKVEDVVVSDRFGSSSRCCFMRDTSKGGMTMEINPEHCLIKDLHKTLYAGRNDLHVKTVALVLFNYANASKRGQICMDELKMVQDQYCLNFGNARQQVQSCMDELKSLEDPSRVRSCMDELALALRELMPVQDNYSKQVRSSMDELMKLQDKYMSLKIFQEEYMNL